MFIREEQKEDYEVVENLIRETYWNLIQPDCEKHFSVHKLRKTNDIIR